MKIALVKPPIIGSVGRGVGFYIDRLLAELNTIPNMHAELVNFSWTENFAAKYDMIHYPYFDPFFLTLPPIKKQKRVVTVHDLTPLIFPQGFPRGVRGEIKWQIQKRLLTSADAVITVSLASKNDINKISGLPADKIYITYEAAGKEFKPVKTANDIKAKYRLPEKYVLYVGDINFNKNLPVLFKAFEHVNKEFKLVLVGKAFAGNQSDDRLKFLGYVPTADLVVIYNLASVYVQPSLYEGFGLPVVEALACGTPVICGKNSSLPEIAGDAVTYADVTDPADLAEKINNIKATGLEITQAKKFSWDKTAQETVQVYKTIL